MIIELKKFGTILTSRQAGQEALSAFRPILRDAGPNDTITIIFDGVAVFTPSWGDEFITPLSREFGQRLELISTNNPSVVETLKILEKTNNIVFTISGNNIDSKHND